MEKIKNQNKVQNSFPSREFLGSNGTKVVTLLEDIAPSVNETLISQQQIENAKKEANRGPY